MATTDIIFITFQAKRNGTARDTNGDGEGEKERARCESAFAEANHFQVTLTRTLNCVSAPL